jgi:hypothetical protein
VKSGSWYINAESVEGDVWFSHIIPDGQLIVFALSCLIKRLCSNPSIGLENEKVGLLSK